MNMAIIAFSNRIHITLQIILLLCLNSAAPLIPVPVPDELIGPGQCPTGSFCIDTTHCTNEYYATSTGMPFYCGPNHQIDSMICCISTDAAVVKSSRAFEKNPHHEDISIEPLDLNDLEEIVRLNRSTSADEDDEVDILSLPVSANQMDENPYDDVELPDSNAELDGHFTTPRDLEAMLENVIEHEINSEQAPSTTRGAMNLGDSEPIQFQIPFQGGGDLVQDLVDEALVNNEIAKEARARTTFNQYTNSPCACEKGEKGDPGPKGEPGEPGKIIYMPVFVNANGYTVPPQPNANGIPPGVPQMPILNPQQMQGQPIPQHPNPTIIPYNVPVNLPTSNPSVPPLVTLTPAPQYSQQQQPQYTQQAPPVQSTASQPQPSSIPFVEGLQARLARQAAGQQRFAPRQYVVRKT